MRTNIEIDDELMAKAMKALNATTKKEAVAKALASVVTDAERVQRQIAMRKWRGKVPWEGELEEWRKD
jgi:Arc/MetJ family transcription regulator